MDLLDQTYTCLHISGKGLSGLVSTKNEDVLLFVCSKVTESSQTGGQLYSDSSTYKVSVLDVSCRVPHPRSKIFLCKRSISLDGKFDPSFPAA